MSDIDLFRMESTVCPFLSLHNHPCYISRSYRPLFACALSQTRFQSSTRASFTSDTHVKLELKKSCNLQASRIELDCQI